MGALMTLILPQTTGSFDWWTMTDQVTRYLDLMVKSAVPESALPPVLLGVNAINVWVGEVLNGGHSQYVGNKGNRTVPNLRRALVTAQACQMQDWVGILRDVIDWVRENPGQAAKMTGFTGGISEALQVQDRKFAATWKQAQTAFVQAVLNLPLMRRVPADQWETEVRAYAKQLLASSPEIRHALACEVAETCRNWLNDRENIAFALACGKSGFTTRCIMGPFPAETDGETYSLFPIPKGMENTNMGVALRSPSRLRFQTGIPPETGKVLADVTKAEIYRVQKMAFAFRLPESVGLRWSITGREFSIIAPMLKVMPGFLWQPHKWRILWSGTHWAVKGSPKLTTFADVVAEWKETLTQDQLTARISDARLDQMSRAKSV